MQVNLLWVLRCDLLHLYVYLDLLLHVLDHVRVVGSPGIEELGAQWISQELLVGLSLEEIGVIPDLQIVNVVQDGFALIVGHNHGINAHCLCLLNQVV